MQEANTWLSRVGQSPNEGMHNILCPTMAVLIKNELMEHPDPNVKVVVTSCLTEVIRITAPYGPYDDDAMKVRLFTILMMKWWFLYIWFWPLLHVWFQEVFKKIVETFAKLDDMNNPSFERRVSTLASVAQDHCFVLMLDLDLNHLILDMFRHFFKTVSYETSPAFNFFS